MAKRQSGAVSLFAVIFAALLLTVLTIGFTKLMINEQQQATDNDLSQSALDSALAGVEDAKRVIRDCQNGIQKACDALNDTTRITDCNVIDRASESTTGDTETIIQSNSSGDEAFNQAYTCVNIFMNTEDYVYNAKDNVAEVIPLKVADGQSFSQIKISWFAESDIQEEETIVAPPEIATAGSLPAKAIWDSNAPPMLRAQLVNPGSSFNLSSLDSGSASQTIFLRPTSSLLPVGPSGEATPTSIILDITNPKRRPGDGDLDAVRDSHNGADTVTCYQDFTFDGDRYACSVIVQLGGDIDASASANTVLRLNTIYGNGAEVRVGLLDSAGSVVEFNGVQPKIDSTGRASSLFRRVEARLRVGSEFTYPGYAVDTENSLCKDFALVRGTVPTSGATTCS